MNKNQNNNPMYTSVLDTDDFLYCESMLGCRPNQITVLIDTLPESIFDIMGDLMSFAKTDSTNGIVNINSELIPIDDETTIKNDRYLIRFNNSIYLRFTILDKEIDEEDSGIVSGVTIFYSPSEMETVDKLVIKLRSIAMQDDESSESESGNFSILRLNTTNNSGFYLERCQLDMPEDDLDLLYDDSLVTDFPKITRHINSDDALSGLTIFYGERGCGKTSYLLRLVSKLKRSVILIPPYLIDTIPSSDFQIFISRYMGSVFVIDGVDKYMFNKYNLYSPILLDIIEGIPSISLKIHFILLSNSSVLDDIDPDIINCNKLKFKVKFDKLPTDKANKLSKKKFTEPVKLSTIFVGNIDKNKIGF